MIRSLYRYGQVTKISQRFGAVNVITNTCRKVCLGDWLTVNTWRLLQVKIGLTNLSKLCACVFDFFCSLFLLLALVLFEWLFVDVSFELDPTAAIDILMVYLSLLKEFCFPSKWLFAIFLCLCSTHWWDVAVWTYIFVCWVVFCSPSAFITSIVRFWLGTGTIFPIKLVSFNFVPGCQLLIFSDLRVDKDLADKFVHLVPLNFLRWEVFKVISINLINNSCDFCVQSILKTAWSWNWDSKLCCITVFANFNVMIPFSGANRSYNWF